MMGFRFARFATDCRKHYSENAECKRTVLISPQTLEKWAKRRPAPTAADLRELRAGVKGARQTAALPEFAGGVTEP